MKLRNSTLIRVSNWWELTWNYLRKNRRTPSGPAPSAADVSYGPHRRQKFDFWLPATQSAEPAPVLIFFHGGGFVRGQKYHSRLLREARELGVATVSANYRLTRPWGITVEDSMQDGAQAIRAVLERAGEWGLDRNRIALVGNSAGGCLALWSSFTETPCPVRCVVTYNSLTSFDPDIHVAEMGGPALNHYWLLWLVLFGARNTAALKTPRLRRIIDSYSPLKRFHPGVPPAFLEFSKHPPKEEKYPETAGLMEILHSPLYGFLAKRRYDAIGQECIVSHPGMRAPVKPIDFIKKHLLDS